MALEIQLVPCLKDNYAYLLHDAAKPLPLPVADWSAEWGVDLAVREAGGLVEPAPVTPVRDIWLLQRKATRPGKAAKERRLAEKKRRAERKRDRRGDYD